jgi:hypothetical protein
VALCPGRRAGKGAAAAKAATETPAGSPRRRLSQLVNPIAGNKIPLGDLDLDFVLLAPLPPVRHRTNCSVLYRTGGLRHGWSLPISDSMRLSALSEHITLARTGFEPVDNLTMSRCSTIRSAGQLQQRYVAG